MSCLFNTLNFFLLVLFTSSTLFAEQEVVEREDWGVFFKKFEVEGTMVVTDERDKDTKLSAYNLDRAKVGFLPASTFKIPHSLFALDTGIVRDEFQVLSWDGVKRFNSEWNRDQNLKSSMRHSVVWVYEDFAKKIGEKDESNYLAKIGYGNGKPTGKAPFWIKGDLKISAIEQINFLQKLYRNQLPFKIEHQRLVKDIMIAEADKDRILRAKSGWTGKLAWWVGWVETPTGAVFFAANIDTPNKKADFKKRELLPRAILKSIGALPNTTSP
ncbi:MAG: class D beta-lactamase [Akkermansiaceae bacterium]